jgi:hypothetical protein
MNSTAKSLSLKILISMVMTVMIQQSIAICQISSEFTKKNFRTIELLVDEKINHENDEFYNYFKSDRLNEYWMTENDIKEGSNSGILSETNFKEEIENEMVIEDWMTKEFNIIDSIDDARDKEEVMELEDWMIQPSTWEINSKPLSSK